MLFYLFPFFVGFWPNVATQTSINRNSVICIELNSFRYCPPSPKYQYWLINLEDPRSPAPLIACGICFFFCTLLFFCVCMFETYTKTIKIHPIFISISSPPSLFTFLCDFSFFCSFWQKYIIVFTAFLPYVFDLMFENILILISQLSCWREENIYDF